MAERAVPRLPIGDLVAPGGVVALLLALAWFDGGYTPTTWLAAALGVLALLVLLVATRRPEWATTRVRLIAVASFAALALWSGASLLWADDAGLAWDGANRTLMYALVFGLATARTWSPGVVAITAGVWSLGLAVMALVVVVRAPGLPLNDVFVAARLAEPIKYTNATVALLLMALWPALTLAASRSTPWLLRGVFLGAAGVLSQVALLGQTRTMLVALPATLIAVLLCTPERVRLLAHGLLVFAAGAVSSSALLDVYPAVFNGDRPYDALLETRRTVLVVVGALVVVGCLIGARERRSAFSVPGVRLPHLSGRGLATGLALGSVLVAVALAGPGRDGVVRAWDSFVNPAAVDQSAGRLSPNSLSTNRYDIWRVAVSEFKAHPVTGIGADNFAVPYLQQRDSVREEPRYPHSLALQIASQLGLVGIALFLGWLGAVTIGAWRARRRLGRGDRVVQAGVIGVVSYWLVHGTFDWLWEVPALGAAAVFFAGLAVSASGGSGGGDEERRARTPSARAASAAVVGAVVLATTFVLPLLAAKDVAAAAEGWPTDVRGAFDRLERARRFNPLSDRPDVVGAVIAGRIDDREQERAFFTRAVDRNPTNWYAHVQLAALESARGQKSAARLHARRALAFNPRDLIVRDVARIVAAGGTVDPRRLDEAFRSRADILVEAGPADGPG